MKRPFAQLSDTDASLPNSSKRHCFNTMGQAAGTHYNNLNMPQMMLVQGYQGHLTREDAMAQMSRLEHDAKQNFGAPCDASPTHETSPYDMCPTSFQPDHSLEYEIQRDMGMVWGGSSNGSDTDSAPSSPELAVASSFSSPQAPVFNPSWWPGAPMMGQATAFYNGYVPTPTQQNNCQPVPFQQTAAELEQLGDKLQAQARRQASTIMLDSYSSSMPFSQ